MTAWLFVLLILLASLVCFGLAVVFSGDPEGRGMFLAYRLVIASIVLGGLDVLLAALLIGRALLRRWGGP